MKILEILKAIVCKKVPTPNTGEDMFYIMLGIHPDLTVAYVDGEDDHTPSYMPRAAIINRRTGSVVDEMFSDKYQQYIIDLVKQTCLAQGDVGVINKKTIRSMTIIAAHNALYNILRYSNSEYQANERDIRKMQEFISGFANFIRSNKLTAMVAEERSVHDSLVVLEAATTTTVININNN